MDAIDKAKEFSDSCYGGEAGGAWVAIQIIEPSYRAMQKVCEAAEKYVDYAEGTYTGDPDLLVSLRAETRKALDELNQIKMEDD